MAITAFPYTAVLDVSANSLLGNNTGSTAAAIALTATQVRTLLSVYTSTQVDSLLAGYQPLDADLTAIAALTTTSFGRSLLTQADAAATRTTIGAGTSSFSGAYGDLTGIPATFTPSAHKTSHATGGSDALTAADVGAVPTSRTLTINGTTQDLSANRTFTVSAGVSGSTGSVDNAMLRADGTGGSTVQASDWLMADNYTTSPNNTVNHASLQATGGTTNVSVSIVPKGSGSFSLQVPDGTSTGGNARGANAVDLSTSRTAATQVASGPYSFAAGYRVTASGPDAGATAFGDNVVASGSRAFACNHNTIASGNFSFAGGLSGTASGAGSFAFGGTASGAGAIAFGGTAAGAGAKSLNGSGSIAGNYAAGIGNGINITSVGAFAFGTGDSSRGFRYADKIHSGGVFTFGGDCQNFELHARCKTTNATATEMFLDGSGQRIFVSAQPNDTSRVCMFLIAVLGVRSDATDIAAYYRKVIVRNNGGTVTLVNSETIGTDFEDVAGTDVSITADNTNKSLKIEVTGIASQTWRWTARIVGTELAPGT